MISFKTYLTELFDKPLPFALDDKGIENGDSAYTFKPNDQLTYRVNFEQSTCGPRENNYGYWIEFTAIDNKSGVGITDNHSSVANQGLHVKVMSTVVAICKEHFTKSVKLKPGDRIYATGTTTSRQKLYNVIIPKFFKELNTKYTLFHKKMDIWEVQ